MKANQQGKEREREKVRKSEEVSRLKVFLFIVCIYRTNNSAAQQQKKKKALESFFPFIS